MSTLRALPRKKIRDQAADQIKELIASQQLGPGDRLPTESELAKTFGISRLSVREATKALEYLGIVQAKTGVGLTVGQIDLERMTAHLGFHPALHRADPLQLINTRVIIETGVLPHVAQRMNEDSSVYDRLRLLADRFQSARKLDQWIELDIEFHRTLLESSGLKPLVAFGDLLRVFFQKFRESIKKAQWQAGAESHRRIIDALRDGEITTATDDLRVHIEDHKSRV